MANLRGVGGVQFEPTTPPAVTFILLVLAAMCLALATVVSAVSSLNIALPDIARHVHATLTQLQWIIDAYAVVFAGLLLLGGRDRRPHRPPAGATCCD